ncbi:hypothetical protein HDV05_001045 [Chytridiales sp. JEL 0842]|nr:hypothetical protein HDV05_001045 [Chytridiales sp. JEL 0842]
MFFYLIAMAVGNLEGRRVDPRSTVFKCLGFTACIERKIMRLLHGESVRHFSAIIGEKALKESVQHFEEMKEPELSLTGPVLEGVDPDDAFSSVPYEKGFSHKSITTDDFLENLYKYFKTKSITTDDFLENLYRYFKTNYGDVNVKILDSVDWKAWFNARLNLQSNREAIFPEVVQLVTTMGRMKYVRTLYRALFKCGDKGKELARKSFRDAVTTQNVASKEDKDYMLYHPVYTPEELANVTVTHRPLQGVRDYLAFGLVGTMRFAFDFATSYTDKVGVMTERQWLNRVVFLETVAGVPGFVAGMARHMRSLRFMKRDNGWIRTLLEEAENERMHLLTFMTLKQPGPLFRFMVLFTQGVFFNLFFASYLLSPKTCHRFVGYLEESAVHTYSHCLKDIEGGNIRHWATTPAPEIAVKYWRLKEGAVVRDVVEAVRADEADHRDTNHLLAKLEADEPNPLNY